MTISPFEPDPRQLQVLEHARGPLVVTGPPGSGKTAVLAERFARLIEGGADPERVALVVRSRPARREARRALLVRLALSLPQLRVMTVHGLAYLVLGRGYESLGYERAPEVLTAADQLALVRDLLLGEKGPDWPAYGSMLHLRGFADQVRQFLFRAQESLLTPADVQARSSAAGLTGWSELAGFYRRYLQVLDDKGAVDFAGLVVQAAVAAGKGEPLFDHLLVDDYQDTTFTAERLLAEARPASLVVAGDAGSHVFSFQGTTAAPLGRFAEVFPPTAHVRLEANHRSTGVALEAWSYAHTSEEHSAVARELRRIHVEDRVPWRDLGVVVRRHGHLAALLRALDDAGVPRSAPERGLSLSAEPATFPFLLALRWLARPDERDGLVEAVLTSDLGGLSPAAARGLIRGALAAGRPASDALVRTDGLDSEEAGSLAALVEVLAEAGQMADRAVLDAFSVLWRGLPYARRLVEAGNGEAEGARDLEAVMAFARAIADAGERGDASVQAFLDLVEAGEGGAGLVESTGEDGEGVRVLTAHGAVGQELDTVVMVGTVEGNFPSLSRPEPMFDLGALEGRISQAERNRLRLEDERRLFRVVLGRARRRVVMTSSEPHGDASRPSAPSRFVAEAGIGWTLWGREPGPDPLTTAEAAGAWRRELADPREAPGRRLAALDGLLALGVDPSTWWFQRDWTGTERPLHENIRTSFSKLDKLENCSLQYVLAEELGLDDRAGYHAWVGHMVHRLIEDCENGLVERSLEALVEEAAARWRQEEFPSLAVSEAFKRLVTSTMLPAWFAVYGDTPSRARELHFVFDFDGATVSGYIDRIGGVQRGGTVITDYKTGRAHDVLHPEENLQLGIYYLAVNHSEELADHRPVRAVELAFLREPAKATQAIPGPMAIAQLGLTDKVRGEYESAVRERLSGLIGRVGQLLETETYRPNPAADCYFCRFKTLCPLFPEGADLFPVQEARR